MKADALSHGAPDEKIEEVAGILMAANYKRFLPERTWEELTDSEKQYWRNLAKIARNVFQR